MKRKIIALCLIVAMLGVAVISGTMAYFTDTAEAVNVMTIGSVKIEQHEYERVVKPDGTYEMVTSPKYGEGYKLQEFTQAKPLLPATGVNAGDYGIGAYFDQLGEGASGGQKVMKGLNNVVDKFVLVENTGRSDAYVRTIIAYEIGNSEKAMFDDEGLDDEHSSLITTLRGDYWNLNEIGKVSIDGNNYYVIEYVYAGNPDRHTGGILPAGEYTYNSLAQIYLRNRATQEDVAEIDGNGNGTYDVLVMSQAIQASGFNDAKKALDEGFGVPTANNDDGVMNVVAWLSKLIIPTVVETADELADAIANGGSIVLGADLTVDADTTMKVAAGKTVNLDLNGNTITAVSDATGANRNIFDVNGAGAVMTVSNGTINYSHTGANMGWNNSTNVFNVTAGGVLNIKDATIINAGGSDMAFCVHLNNWGEVTLNVENSTLKSSYIAVRAFNSGYDMNNITIKNSTLEGKYGLWVHNYIGDLDSTKHSDEAIKARLNFDVFNGTNTFNVTKYPGMLGFNTWTNLDANGNVVTP